MLRALWIMSQQPRMMSGYDEPLGFAEGKEGCRRNVRRALASGEWMTFWAGFGRCALRLRFCEHLVSAVFLHPAPFDAPSSLLPRLHPCKERLVC